MLRARGPSLRLHFKEVPMKKLFEIGRYSILARTEREAKWLLNRCLTERRKEHK
jgi:hypothetical protein